MNWTLHSPFAARSRPTPTPSSIRIDVVHVARYASRFLFTSEQLNQPVERLSGGERARVLIARLMLQPADVLILDEPTNDLDIPTLEILEESLLEFPGALVLVTHDRYLLDRVTNAVLGLDGRGNAALFADYLQWETWRDQQTPAGSGAAAEESPQPTPAVSSTSPTRRKLSYMEQREYDTLEKRIDEADARLRAAEQRIQVAEVVIDPEALTAALAELEAAKSRAQCRLRTLGRANREDRRLKPLSHKSLGNNLRLVNSFA